MLKAFNWLEKWRTSSLVCQRHKQNQRKPSIGDQQIRIISWKVHENNQPSAPDRIQTMLPWQSWRFYGQSHCNQFYLQRKTGNQALNFIKIFLRTIWSSKTNVDSCWLTFKKRLDRKENINISLVNVWRICQNWKDRKNARDQREKGSEGKEKTLRKKKTWKRDFLKSSWVWIAKKNPWTWARACQDIWSERAKKNIVLIRKKFQVMIKILKFFCFVVWFWSIQGKIKIWGIYRSRMHPELQKVFSGVLYQL